MSYDPSQTRDEEGQWTEAGARKRAVKKLAKKLPRTPTAPTTAEHVTAKGKVVLTYKMVGRTPTVEAHLGDRLVARAEFVTEGVAKDKIKGGTVRVADDMRRMGVATAMYDHATRVTGKSYVPSDFQLDDGKHLVAAYKKRRGIR